jgi:hypothetical protein
MAKYPGYNKVSTHYRNNYECKKLYGPRPQVSTRFILDWARILLDEGKVNHIDKHSCLLQK